MNFWIMLKGSMKKRKGSLAIIFVLIALASLILYSSVNVVGVMSNAVDEKCEELNNAHYEAVYYEEDQQAIRHILENTKNFKELEIKKALFSMTNAKMKDVTIDKEDSMNVSFMKKSIKSNISKLKIIDEGEKWTENSVVVSAYLKYAKGFKTGDTVEIKVSGEKIKLKIYGFCEDINYSVPTTMSCYQCYVSDTTYEKVKKFKNMQEMDRFMVRLNDANQSMDYYSATSNQLNKQKSETIGENYSATYYENSKGASTLMIQLLLAIAAIFAVLIILVSLVVVQFNIKIQIENDMRNIGILQAAGYTSKQLRLEVLFEYGFVALMAVISGSLLSNLIHAPIRNLAASSVGLNCRIDNHFSIMFLCDAAIIVSIILVVWIVSKRYKKITVLDALRGGVENHHFKKNPLPLQKSVFGINSSLGMKELFQKKKQNIGISFIVALLVFSCAMMSCLYYNFAVDKSKMYDLVGKEICDIALSKNADPNNDFISLVKKVRTMDEVAHVNESANLEMTIRNEENKKEVETLTDIYEKPNEQRTHTLVEGRNPKADNELVLSNYLAKQLDVKINDSVTMKKGNKEYTVIIVGTSQKIAGGVDGSLITPECAKKIVDDYSPNFVYIYLKKGVDVKKTLDKVEELYAGDARIGVVDYMTTYDSILGSFNDAVELTTQVLLLLCIIVVVLIVVLIIRMRIVHEKKMFGIYKGLGFTSKQLMVQVVAGFVPTIIFGCILGGVIAYLFVNPAIGSCLSAIGIVSCDLFIPFYIVGGIVAGLSLIAVLVSLACTYTLTKVEAYKMIVE